MPRPSLALLSCGLLAALMTPLSAQGDGWTSLFDGETLAGWTQRNGTATYEVQDGAIVGTTVKGSPNSFLCSDRFYGDFELEFDVKLMDDRLNSGVQIRSHSFASHKKGRVHGYQVEISTNGHAGFVYDEARRGWLSVSGACVISWSMTPAAWSGSGRKSICAPAWCLSAWPFATPTHCKTSPTSSARILMKCPVCCSPFAGWARSPPWHSMSVHP